MRSYVISPLYCDLNPSFLYMYDKHDEFGLSKIAANAKALWLIDRASSFIKLPAFRCLSLSLSFIFANNSSNSMDAVEHMFCAINWHVFMFSPAFPYFIISLAFMAEIS